MTDSPNARSSVAGSRSMITSSTSCRPCSPTSNSLRSRTTLLTNSASPSKISKDNPSMCLSSKTLSSSSTFSSTRSRPHSNQPHSGPSSKIPSEARPAIRPFARTVRPSTSGLSHFTPYPLKSKATRTSSNHSKSLSMDRSFPITSAMPARRRLM